jgi:hypothetical protein
MSQYDKGGFLLQAIASRAKTSTVSCLANSRKTFAIFCSSPSHSMFWRHLHNLLSVRNCTGTVLFRAIHTCYNPALYVNEYVAFLKTGTTTRKLC